MLIKKLFTCTDSVAGFSLYPNHLRNKGKGWVLILEGRLFDRMTSWVDAYFGKDAYQSVHIYSRKYGIPITIHNRLFIFFLR